MRSTAFTPVIGYCALRRAAVLACTGALLAGCDTAGGRDATDAPEDAAAVGRARTTATSAGVAGTWLGQSVQAGQDTAVATWRLVTTADTSGWTVTFLPAGPPLPVRVLAREGDSVVTEIGPYPSPTRPGVELVTRTAGRFRGDRFTGTYEARRLGSGDSAVAFGRVDATRAP